MEIFAKIATSLDGKIALSNGESKWISCDVSRQFVHNLRAKSDAILTTSKTAMKDNSTLNVRLENCENIIQPKRILLDTFLKTPFDYNIYKSENSGPTIVFCSKFAADHKKNYLRDNNIKFIEIDTKEGQINLISLKAHFKELGFENIMLEVGGTILRSFLNLGLVDKIIWFRAPIIIGNDGISAFGDFGFSSLKQAIKLKLEKVEIMGVDIVETYTFLEKKCLQE